jgi:hypothetical protein
VIKPSSIITRTFYGAGLRFIKPEEITPCDVVFSALPSGQIMALAGSLIENGTKIIDLGADFRLRDRAVWERVYNKTHENWVQRAGQHRQGRCPRGRPEYESDVRTSRIDRPDALRAPTLLIIYITGENSEKKVIKKRTTPARFICA